MRKFRNKKPLFKQLKFNKLKIILGQAFPDHLLMLESVQIV